VLVGMSFGNDASNDSMRVLLISLNCREMTAKIHKVGKAKSYMLHTFTALGTNRCS